jgi:hypothetical protein
MGWAGLGWAGLGWAKPSPSGALIGIRFTYMDNIKNICKIYQNSIDYPETKLRHR